MTAEPYFGSLEVLPASDDDYSDEESESGEESEGDDEEYVQRPARKRARKEDSALEDVEAEPPAPKRP